MRHPFWTWTGWLTLGLAGCISGLDGRKVGTHTVSDQSTAKPVVVGPLRKSLPPFVSNETNSTVPNATDLTNTKRLKKPLLRLEHVLNSATTKPTGNKTPLVRRDAQVVPAQFQKTQAADPALLSDLNATTPLNANHRPLPTTTSSTVPAMPLPPAPMPFAEFERAIPLKPGGSTRTLIEVKEPVLAPPAEIEDERETDNSAVGDPQSQALPMIIPAQQPSNQPASPRELPSPVTSLFQERPAVTESSTSKPMAHPRDVALLVEQVFEDLRQRRLDNARERTEWLKRLVANGANPTSAAVDANDAIESATTAEPEPHVSTDRIRPLSK